MRNGLLHIYCGDGKGKTTAATGLAVRAAGSGLKVLFGRFLKNERSGELKILDCIQEIDVLHLPRSYGFYKTLSEADKKAAGKMYEELWETLSKGAVSGEYHMLVIDEFMAAWNYGLIDKERALDFLRTRPSSLEVVLTGRNPDERLIELADYVSEIKKVKHPYDQNISARKGIEF